MLEIRLNANVKWWWGNSDKIMKLSDVANTALKLQPDTDVFLILSISWDNCKRKSLWHSSTAGSHVNHYVNFTVVCSWSSLKRNVTQYCIQLSQAKYWSVIGIHKPQLYFCENIYSKLTRFQLFTAAFPPVLLGSFSVLRVLWRKWMAMLVFDLHKEHHVFFSQPCCYSFCTALTGEKRKQREKRRDMCPNGAEDGGGTESFSLSPYAVFLA